MQFFPSEMTNPFAGVGVPDGTGAEITNLVDQAVVLQSALVPKLPEIGVTDGMIPIIDQIYADSGSNSTFTPGTTINFNFGNSHGKLVDWTQSRLEFDMEVVVTCRAWSQAEVQKEFGADTELKGGPIEAAGKAEDQSGEFVGQHVGVLLGPNGIFCGLRHGAQAFSQVTFAGAGRPITMNDFEMTALAQHLLTTAEGNVSAHIGDITTTEHHGCGTYLQTPTGALDPSGKAPTQTHIIHVSIPLTSVMPMFGTVDNYLLSTTSGIELRLTVTNHNNIFVFTSNTDSAYQLSDWDVAKGGWQTLRALSKRVPIIGGLFGSKTAHGQPSHIYYKELIGNDVPCPSRTLGSKADSMISLSAKLNRIKSIHVDLVSTQHPDDYILNMINGICSTRGLFYPNQMHMCTPFNMHLEESASPQHHSILVPVVSGWRNIDAVFCWWTRRDDYTRLVKMPMLNVYTSLNGSFKTPVHSYRDRIWLPMTEQAQQFNRAFGTVNSKIVSPMADIMREYLPEPSTVLAVNDKGEISDPKLLNAAICNEAAFSHSHICNSCVWELEKSSWMNGPDFSQHSNKYQLVFDLEAVPKGLAGEYVLWVCQRFDSYTHVYNGYINILTTKEEVAMALQQAQAGQAITA